MTRKTNNTKGLGRSIQIAKKQHADRLRAQADRLAGQMGVGLATGGSVLEQTSLDDLIATVQLKKEAWAEETGEAEFVQGGPIMLPTGGAARLEAEKAAAAKRGLMSIPRRPAWNEGTSADQLAELEVEAFTEWRRKLAQASQDEGLFMTPYERNLDFWRQLWRCVERSDLLVQIVDARDPDFYLCRDLARYVSEVDKEKRLMVLVNKADFLSDELRVRWREHFQSTGVDAVFFSALRELRRQQREQLSQPPSAVRRSGREAVGDASAQVGSSPPSPLPSGGRPASVWAQAAREQESDSEGEAEAEKTADGGAGAPATGAVLDPANVAVPGLEESDDDLAEEASLGRQSGDNEDNEDAELLGPRAEDELEGVADAGRLVEELLLRLPDAGCGGVSGQATRRRPTVGFVGYPNVGKSTVINAIVGRTMVGMSRTPGKTKHIQTLELTDVGITLCDCPGLVFPSVAATKAHLVINNTVHIDDLRECFSPIALIVEKVGWKAVLDRYDCAHAVQDARQRSGDHVLDDTHAFLAALAVSRHHFLRVGVPDENWAARKVLKDFVSGALLHCEPPPATESSKPSTAPARAAVGADSEGAEEAAGEEAGSDEDEEDDDFGDLQSFLNEARGSGTRRERTMTKRRMRQLSKQLMKGKGAALESAGHVGVGIAACHRQGARATSRPAAAAAAC